MAGSDGMDFSREKKMWAFLQVFFLLLRNPFIQPIGIFIKYIQYSTRQ